MQREKLFGTDGIRGLANRFPITGELAMSIGRALISVLSEYSHPQKRRRLKVVIGKDTRISGYMLESAIASGICSMGADAIFLGTIPTPAVAFMTRQSQADAGIMISASHNHYSDNGIKIFSADGYKLPDELEERIALRVMARDVETILPTGDHIGTISRLDHVGSRYLNYLKGVLPRDLTLNGLKVAIDCAHGASYKIAPLILQHLGAEIFKVGVRPSGSNINENCGAIHPKRTAQLVTTSNADIGISLDGDADRCILVDEKGEVVDGDQILGICAIDLASRKMLLQNSVVTTPMSNIGLSLSLSQYGISTFQAQVGDRYVVEMMKTQGFNLGGEQSGHIIFLDSCTTGDGLLAALRVAEIMARTGKKLSELKQAIHLFPQVKVDVKVSRKDPFAHHPIITDAIDSAKYALQNRGRVFVRYSGTEPLARVMLEGENYDQIHNLSQNIASSLQQVLS
jgi:phosphoglucosamine mutase